MMEFDHVLIRYGELGLKGKNMKQFIKQLQRNIKYQLKDYPQTKVTRTQGRMFVELHGADPEAVMEKCRHVFGISSLSLAIKVDNTEEAMKDGVLAAMENNPGAKTFKVAVRRANKSFPIGSQEMNQILGGHILKNIEALTVDVHHPDVEVRIDIRQKATYITAKVVQGLGGLPVGTDGKTLLLLSGGIDSPVAGYLMMKRGLDLEMIHFHSPPFTSERAKQKVIDLTKILASYGTGKIKMHIVPFTKLQQEIFRELPERYGMTVMRRIMMRIAEKISNERNILSLTTGESLGQVASQTMASMNAINEVTNLPILRPLVALDKHEIIEHAQKIGTYDISIRPYEDCCTIFVPKAPITNPRREKVLELESHVDFSPSIEEAVQGVEQIIIEAGDDAEEFIDLL